MLAFTQIQPPLTAATLQALDSFGFTHMTPVQSATIPLFLKNKDVCVEATTGLQPNKMSAFNADHHIPIKGSGKTIAFGVCIFEILISKDVQLRKHDVGALVVAPTRFASKKLLKFLFLTCVL